MRNFLLIFISHSIIRTLKFGSTTTLLKLVFKFQGIIWLVNSSASVSWCQVGFQFVWNTHFGPRQDSWISHLGKPPRQSETSEYIYGMSDAFEGVVRRLCSICPSITRSLVAWCCPVLTTVTPHSPTLRIDWPADYNLCSTRQIDVFHRTEFATHSNSFSALGTISRMDRMAILVHHCLHGLVPQYVADEFKHVWCWFMAEF